METVTEVLHYPRLDTILMVEEFVKKHSGEFRKRELWEKLPKKTMYQTYCIIINYLLESGKVGIDRKEHISWIWNPKLVRKYIGRKDLDWKK